MKISSISAAAAVTLLAGKASASTPTRLRAMTEEVAANATSASDAIAEITDEELQDKFVGNPFFQALVMPDNATESQSFEDLFAEEDEKNEEDELSGQFDLLEVDSSMSMAGSIAASQNSKSGGSFGWSSKSGKGNDCSIENMSGRYEFNYDVWVSKEIWFFFRKKLVTFYLTRARSVLFKIERPYGPLLSRNRGRGAMYGKLAVLLTSLDVVAVQTGVSENGVVPFQITVKDYPEASAQGEYNCKTEEVYFGYVADTFTGGFSTREPAKKMSGPS